MKERIDVLQRQEERRTGDMSYPKHPRFGIRGERQIEALKLHETGRQSVIKLEIEIRYYHSDMPDRFDYVVKVRRFDDVVGKDEL